MMQTNLSQKIESHNVPQTISDYLDPHLKEVEKILKETDEDVPSILTLMVNHVINGGSGKKVRANLTLATCNLFGDINEHAYQLAASIELIHTATLLHDDVMDEADMRRDNEAAHTKFGNVMSILFGDFLLASSLKRLLTKDDPRILRVIANTCSSMAKGEMRQLSARHEWQLTNETYKQTIFEKTATLFSASCQLGGLAANASDQMISHLEKMGKQIGMAFQIIDDVMDYTMSQIGKKPGRDFFDGKITLPIILAIQQGIELDFWKNIFSKEERDQTDFSTAVACLEKHKLLDQSRDVAKQYIDKALSTLKNLPQTSPVFLHLQDFIYNLGERSR